ncbi:Na+/melibiose symporter-like transporter [Candidatus Methylobacter favarea]|uniref:Na+/melibiose symporter-like transporter n=1 Tax=Candidatus Methylobacter favarea TaxID=2707345 RepID=A0A8S0XRU0_9GAMM|nr:MFS transporter [Candidatus Methylobacter favarea]CAA9890249.1 Na+/melibiose symporter-like transporter [Candidatus Methylobacter favarea]
MQEKTLTTDHPLSRMLMVFYGLPHLTHAIVALPLALFIPSYYADELALPMASVGLAIAASRLLDIISDPVVGIISDRLQTRWGRRKPWLALGTPLLILSAWMVFVPGEGISVAYLFGWTSLLYLAYTFVDLPYKAWGAELSTHYSERSRVTAWREAFGAFGQILFLGTLMAMALKDITDVRLQLLAIAILIVISQPLLVTVTLWKVPERMPEVLAGSEQTISKGWQALALLGKNRAFLRTLAAVVLFGTAVLMQATLHRFVLNHIVKAPDLFAPMILAENIGSILCLPLWIWISDHIGKHRAVSLAALWIALWSVFLPVVGEGDSVLYVTLILLRGSSLASIFFLSSSIGADVVDYDTVVSGKQRTGLYFSVWGMASKLSIGLGVVLGTSLPAFFGFNPAETTHTAAAISSLMVIYGWLPCLILVLGVPFLWNFPIDKKHQQELRNKITAALMVEDLSSTGK